ncbi:MAG: ketoacyl-ACP synthase III [Chitinophagaceae bacterium]|nr:ketoacyl-ACP synthase III [Oligoflexus sp.]
MKSTYLHAMGHFHPETVVPNSFFDTLDIGSEESWIEDRTGIRSRRSVLAIEDIADLRWGRKTLQQLRQEGRVLSIADFATEAWKCLITRYPDLDPKTIDTLICGTSIPDFDIPANACTIAAKLGWSCLSFDANSACSSFVLDLHVARQMISTGAQKTMAIFNPERYSLRMDYTDRNSCILFGDGCSAAILSSEHRPGSLRVVDTLLYSDPSGCDLVKVPEGQCFSQNGKAVQKFAITRTIEVTEQILARNDLSPKNVKYFTGHQANLRMITSAADRLGIATDHHLHNVAELGNQGAAGAPSVLSMNWDRFEKGDLIVLAVVGSGLTWGATILEKT